MGGVGQVKLALVVVLLLGACAPDHGTPRYLDASPPTTAPITTTTTVPPAPSSTAVRIAPRGRGSRSTARNRTVTPHAPVRAVPGVRWVSSTAYCLTGTMANGQRVYRGAVAMNGVPFGTKYRVLDGPLQGAVLTVSDRIGSGSSFDVAMPGDCPAARAYGRRRIRIEQVR
jgi:hypothetical protein